MKGLFFEDFTNRKTIGCKGLTSQPIGLWNYGKYLSVFWRYHPATST